MHTCTAELSGDSTGLSNTTPGCYTRAKHKDVKVFHSPLSLSLCTPPADKRPLSTGIHKLKCVGNYSQTPEAVLSNRTYIRLQKAFLLLAL